MIKKLIKRFAKSLPDSAKVKLFDMAMDKEIDGLFELVREYKKGQDK